MDSANVIICYAQTISHKKDRRIYCRQIFFCCVSGPVLTVCRGAMSFRLWSYEPTGDAHGASLGQEEGNTQASRPVSSDARR